MTFLLNISAVYVKKFQDNVIEYYALRDIEEGEEIHINYNGRPDSMEPVWFQMVQEPSH
jgi:SET domain-containing protein